ncbi:MAG: fumarylacetoacetate hydrolase, partial [Hyphomicrobiales bacterium]|nr:fumarylacetoacetate hydrolase [Hyphomicrobiales bacterium]
MSELNLAAKDILPTDGPGLLVGRVWSNECGGPCPVLVDGEVLRDLSALSPTMSGLLERPMQEIAAAASPSIGRLDDFLSNGFDKGPAGQLLAPCDLQAVKAAGVTFAGSMLERVIEERAKGEPERAEAIRRELAPVVGESLRGVQPGSEKAAKVKALLQERGLWSQYLEVGIGPDAEVFTKAQPMSSVGCGAKV